MNASRSLDKLVAENVFGWTDIRAVAEAGSSEEVDFTGKDPTSKSGYRSFLLRYSTDKEHTREVLGFLKRSWTVDFHSPRGSGVWVLTLARGETLLRVEDESGPRAVCLAALRSLGLDVRVQIEA